MIAKLGKFLSVLFIVIVATISAELAWQLVRKANYKDAENDRAKDEKKSENCSKT